MLRTTTSQFRRATRPGFTLVELMVMAAVCVIIMAVLASVFGTGIDAIRQFIVVLLVAVLLFGAVYMLALRPKADSGGSSTPAKPAPQATTSPAKGPGSSIPGGLGKSVTKARGAAGQSDAANQRLQQATGGAGGSSSTSTSAAPVSPVPPPVASAAARRGATGGT